MPRRAPLKCWIGNYDGQRLGMVFATSARRAANAVNTSLGHFNNYWCVQRELPGPGGLGTGFETRWSGGPLTWVKGRCP